MVFFQTILLAGYAYAHVLTRLPGLRWQVLVHVVVMTGGLAALPIAAATVMTLSKGALLIGVPLGIIAGYAGGIFDWIVTRLIDFFSALPWYLVVLYLVMMLRPSLENLILALAITSWVGPCRVVRGLTLSVREQDYVEAARALGIPTGRILANHITRVQIARPILAKGNRFAIIFISHHKTNPFMLHQRIHHHRFALDDCLGHQGDVAQRNLMCSSQELAARVAGALA